MSRQNLTLGSLQVKHTATARNLCLACLKYGCEQIITDPTTVISADISVTVFLLADQVGAATFDLDSAPNVTDGKTKLLVNCSQNTVVTITSGGGGTFPDVVLGPNQAASFLYVDPSWKLILPSAASAGTFVSPGICVGPLSISGDALEIAGATGITIGTNGGALPRWVRAAQVDIVMAGTPINPTQLLFVPTINAGATTSTQFAAFASFNPGDQQGTGSFQRTETTIWRDDGANTANSTNVWYPGENLQLVNDNPGGSTGATYNVSYVYTESGQPLC